jgi:hypothetical protein
MAQSLGLNRILTAAIGDFIGAACDDSLRHENEGEHYE